MDNMDGLLKLLSIPSESRNCDMMYGYLLKLAFANHWSPLKDEKSNLYVTKGEAKTYPCIVAHMDTVHKINKGGIEPQVFRGMIYGLNPATMEQTGIGGDDKCGIWAALHCMERLPVCKAVFFVDEEVGCQGSQNCDLNFFSDCRFILQADRRGNDDFVTRISGGALGSDEFHEAVAPILKRYDYKACTGMMTDVMALRDRKVGVSCANFSAGYYNPHQRSEFIDIADLETACNLIEEICLELTASYPFIETKGWTSSNGPYQGYGGRYLGEGGYYGGQDDGDSEFPEWAPALKSTNNHTPSVDGVVVHGSNGNGAVKELKSGTYYICNECRFTTHETKCATTAPVPICVYCASDMMDRKSGVSPAGKNWAEKEASFWRRLREGKKHRRKSKRQKS